MRRTRLITLIVVVGVAVIGYLVYQHVTDPFPKPPQEVVDLATSYIKARESQVGADQASATSWLEVAKPLVTAEWLATLKGQVPPPDYATAQDKGYVVSAKVTDCVWNKELAKPTSSSGSVFCTVTDRTLDKASSTEVNAANLPKGWTHNGAQTPAILTVVKQGGKWLVNGDVTGQGQ